MPYDDVIATTARSSQDRRPGRRILEAGRVGCLATALALAAAPAAFGADPPYGSHGEEADAPAVTTSTMYSRAVRQICADAVLFEQSHRIGTRTGALAVAGDIRASSRRRLALVATVQPAPGQEAMAVRWLALEQRLAEAYALNYVRIYDLIAAPRSPQAEPRVARRLARLMRAPERLRMAAARAERQLQVPDCTGG
jgi:hypothetical protein